MTIHKAFSRRSSVAAEAAPPPEPVAACGEPSELAAEIAAASAALVGEMESLVALAIREAFGAIAAEGYAAAAVREALARHGRGAKAVVYAPPADLERRREEFRRDAEPPTLAADPLLAEGEIVLECVFGRLHLGSRQLAETLVRRLA